MAAVSVGRELVDSYVVAYELEFCELERWIKYYAAMTTHLRHGAGKLRA